ncbi:MAG: BrnA antitoxin family protein [Pseudomonadota bacterium]
MEHKLTKKQSEHHYYMVEALQRFEWDMHHAIEINYRIPSEWHEISTRRESAKKKICFSVEEDVLKWFRSMGPGYQRRMNDVLKGFMRAKLAGLLKGDETLDAFKERAPNAPRPEWGDLEKRFG